jgi:hypothetical protein
MPEGPRDQIDDVTRGLAVAHPKEPRQWIYRNLTPWRIHADFGTDGNLVTRAAAATTNGNGHHPPDAEGVNKVLAIPALGEITVPSEDARQLNTLKMRRLGQIELRPAPSELATNVPRIIVVFGWLALALVFGAWALFGGGASALPWAWVVATVVAVPVAALVAATARELYLYRRFDDYCRARATGHRSLENVERGGRIRTFLDGVPRHIGELAVLIGAVVVSVVGLGVAIHLTTQLVDLLPIDYGELLRLHNPFHGVSSTVLDSPAFWQLLVGRVAQWVLVSVAALVPAAMYFQFDRERLASVQRRWIQEVFRLDPTVRTVRDIEAKYGSQIESSFGDLGPDSSLRIGSGRRSPVIVATILLVVGWFLVISATQVPDLVPGANGELVWPSASGAPGSFPVSSFFHPQLSLIGYAFLGAYVFTLFHVLRSYQRRDLHPKSYNTVVVRILAAYALGLVVSVVYDGPAAEVFLFFVGFLPESALVWMREKVSSDDGVWGAFPLREPAPLTDLEGIDLYDRTRLAEEGINNVEALAHTDIVELMSNTRISAAQLVDWTDQAILYLRMGGDASVRNLPKGAPPPPGRAACPDVHRNLCHLRAYGIRTATDLLQVYEQAVERGLATGTQAAEVDALRVALELPGTPTDTSVRAIQTVIDTLPDEEWFAQVLNWRHSEFGAVDSWYWYLDGHDWTRVRTKLPARVEGALRPFPSVPMAGGGAPVNPAPST